MKHSHFPRVAIIATIFFAASCLLSQPLAAESKVKRLKVVGSWSSLTLFKNLEKPFWTETLNKELDPGIKVSMSSLGQVKLKGAAVLRQMKLGVFDVVSTVADYVVSDSPNLAGLDLPAMAPDITLARLLTEAYRPVVEDALAKDFNAKLLAISPYPAQVLFCKEKLSGLKDLKGRKIRASGWTTSEFVTALGATGVTISFSEVPQSLQRGVVDCAITGSLSGYSAGWGEVSSFVYPLPIGGWDYVITSMNMRTWNKFSADEQEQLKNLVKIHLENEAWSVTKFETAEGIACLTGQKCSQGPPNHMQAVAVVENDIALSKQTLKNSVLPAWAEKVDDKIITKWNRDVGSIINIQAE